MAVDLAYLDFCRLARPDWSPEDGAASSFSEFLILLTTVEGLIFLSNFALFLWKRGLWTGVLLGGLSLWLWFGWSLHYALDDDLFLGRLGGCVGSLTVTYAVLLSAAVLGFGVAGYRLYRRFA